MPRLDGTSQQYFQALSQDLKRENLSPDQVSQLSKAVAALPQDAKVTSEEVESIARRLGMSAPHKATLVFALMMHRYGAEMHASLKAANGLQDGVAGMLDALLQHARTPDGKELNEQLHLFWAAHAGPRSADEESGREVFRLAPPQVIVKGERIEAHVQQSAFTHLDRQMAEHVGIDPDSPDHNARVGRNYHHDPAVLFGIFHEGAEGGWVFRPAKQGEKQPDDIALGRFGVQALELLNTGLSAMISQRSQGQRNVDAASALEVVHDVGVAGALLKESMELIAAKQKDLTAQRTQRGVELRMALGNYRVAHIGSETVNALVHQLFPGDKAK